MLSIIVFSSFFTLIGGPFHTHPREAEETSSFSLHYVVDRMSTYHWYSKGGLAATPIRSLVQRAERYSVTYQIDGDGDFFLEMILLSSPWSDEDGYRSETGRIVLNPERIEVYGFEGKLLFTQEIGLPGWGQIIKGDLDFSRIFSSLSWFAATLDQRRELLEEKDLLTLEDGSIVIQSCGQQGPLRLACEPGDCSRVIYDKVSLRPMVVEHGPPGEDPEYVQYFQWSIDGTSLEKSFEQEMLEDESGQILMIETVSHYFDYSMKTN